jgi:hypothetical protein
MSHRAYKYKDGKFVALVLRQQTDLGEGLAVAAEKLRKPGAPAFAPPTLIAAAGATRVPDSSGAGEGAGEGAVTKPRPQPMARTKAARKAAESVASQRRFGREESEKQRAAAVCSAQQAHCQQSLHFWCKLHPDGRATCNGVFPSELKLRKHIQAGEHLEGAIRPFPSGVASGRGTPHDRNLSVVQTALSAVIDTSSAALAAASPTLRPALDFRLMFADGKQYEVAVPEAGWACAQRLPIVYTTADQFEFIVNAFTIGDHANHQKFSAESAREYMLVVGTAAAAAQFPNHPYFGTILDRPRFCRTDIMDVSKIKGYFGMPKAKLIEVNACVCVCVG